MFHENVLPGERQGFWCLATFLLLLTNPAHASCGALPVGTPIPRVIKAGACLELTSGRSLPPGLEVHGHLILRFGQAFALGDDVDVVPGGRLSIRGSLSMSGNARLALSGLVECPGSLSLGPGVGLEINDGGKLHNQGKVYLGENASIWAFDGAEIVSGGVLSLDGGVLNAFSAEFVNRGSMDIYHGGQALFQRRGHASNYSLIKVQEGSGVLLMDETVLSNHKQLVIAGTCSMSQQASLDNHGMVSVKETGTLVLNDGTLLSNDHIVGVGGPISLSGTSRIENRRNLRVEPGQRVSLQGNSVLLNHGTIHSHGDISEDGGRIDNQHIMFQHEGNRVTKVGK